MIVQDLGPVLPMITTVIKETVINDSEDTDEIKSDPEYGLDIKLKKWVTFVKVKEY